MMILIVILIVNLDVILLLHLLLLHVYISPFAQLVIYKGPAFYCIHLSLSYHIETYVIKSLCCNYKISLCMNQKYGNDVFDIFTKSGFTIPFLKS